MARNVDQFVTPTGHATIDHTGIPGVGGGPTPLIQAQNNGGAIQGPQPTLNLIPSGVAMVSVVDNPGQSRVDVTVDVPAPPAETFTAAVHSLTDHTGIPGVGSANLWSDSVFDDGATVGTTTLTIPGGTLTADGQVIEVFITWTANVNSIIDGGGKSNYPPSAPTPSYVGLHVRLVRTTATTALITLDPIVNTSPAPSTTQGQSITWANPVVIQYDWNTAGTNATFSISGQRVH